MDISWVPPKSSFVPCSSHLSSYWSVNGPRTTSTSTTQPTSTYTPPPIVDCASLIRHNITLTGSTWGDDDHRQACTAWAASRNLFAGSPQSTASVLYGACRAQSALIDIDKDPLLTALTGSVIAQVYPGSLLGPDYSDYRSSTSFPIPYSTRNPSGGIITTVSTFFSRYSNDDEPRSDVERLTDSTYHILSTYPAAKSFY